MVYIVHNAGADKHRPGFSKQKELKQLEENWCDQSEYRNARDYQDMWPGVRKTKKEEDVTFCLTKYGIFFSLFPLTNQTLKVDADVTKNDK
jgi:hypothetical protein